MCLGVFKSIFGCGRSSKKPETPSGGLGRSMTPRASPIAARSAASLQSVRSTPVPRTVVVPKRRGPNWSSFQGPSRSIEYPTMTPVNASLASLPESPHRTPAAGPVKYGAEKTPKELHELAQLRVAGAVGSNASSSSVNRAARQPLRAYDKGKFPKTLRSSEYRPKH